MSEFSPPFPGPENFVEQTASFKDRKSHPFSLLPTPPVPEQPPEPHSFSLGANPDQLSTGPGDQRPGNDVCFQLLRPVRCAIARRPPRRRLRRPRHLSTIGWRQRFLSAPSFSTPRSHRFSHFILQHFRRLFNPVSFETRPFWQSLFPHFAVPLELRDLHFLEPPVFSPMAC